MAVLIDRRQGSSLVDSLKSIGRIMVRFSPVAKMTSVRVVISLAVYHDWKLWQLDVKNAFLYGEIDKDIHMVGYVSQAHPEYVGKLKNDLYGLKQAHRAWNGKIAEYLQFCDYFASNSDSSLFVKKQSKVHVIVLLYVDDMIVIGNDDEEIVNFGLNFLFGLR